MNRPPYAILDSRFIHRPVGRLGLALLIVAICTAPAVLFFDPVTLVAGGLARRA